MTVINAAIVGGKYVPESWVSDAYGTDFNGTNYCFITEADLQNPGARELASPSNVVEWVVEPGSPVTVPADLFGDHVIFASLGTTTIPSGFHAKWLRSHDCAIEWNKLQPNNGTDPIDWANMDRWVAAAEAIGAKPLYVVMATPTWASMRPAEVGPYGLGSSAPPTNMADLSAFMTQVASRYGSRINHYEVWNEVNMVPLVDRVFFYSGTWTQLADIAKTVNQAVKAVNPSAVIIGPSSVGWGAPGGANDPTVYVPQFLQAKDSGGVVPLSSWIDWMSCHLYYLYQFPSTIPLQFQRVQTAMATAGIPTMPVINTEGGILEAQYRYFDDVEYLKTMLRHIVLTACLPLEASIWYGYDLNAAGLGYKNRGTGIYTQSQALITLLAGSTILQLSQVNDGRLFGVVERDGVQYLIAL